MGAQRRRAALLVAVVAALAMVSVRAQSTVHRGFIRMQDGKFVDQACREFVFVGANGWRWPQIAANQYPLSTPGDELPSEDYLDHNGVQINPVLWAIRELQQSGVTVLRTFAGGVTTDFAMIETPGTAGADGTTWPNGKYNWDAVTGLDKLVGWSKAHGIKVIISFVDNWSPADSKMSLVWAAGNATGQSLTADDFYSNELVKEYYKNYVSFILNHVNKQTGLQYKNDPAILGYNLINEPRCNCAPTVVDSSTGFPTADGDPNSDCADVQNCFTNVQAWVKEMAAFVKSIAPNQLLGVGDEGFATFLNNADSTTLVDSNPGSWAAISGDSFSLQATRGIDYHSTHLWVDDWGIAPALPPPYEADSSSGAAPANPSEFAFHRRFLSVRSAQAQQDGKPFVIEEFGKYVPRPADSDSDIARIRDPWFDDVFSIVSGSIKSGGPIAGVLMWKYGVSPYHNRTDKNWISVKDSTWTDIIEPLGQVLSADKSTVANCRAATGKAAQLGRGISTQSVSAKSGSEVVTANTGGHGRRRLRGDDTQLWSYVSRGANMMAVDAGDAIKGVADVTGVTRGPRKCARACGLEPLCDAFHYNKDLERCQLRSNVGSVVGFDADGWQTYWQEDKFQD